MKLGVFGGTFDPIHFAHLRLAEAAREFLRLDEVLFVPVGDPVHREDPPHAGREDRYAMCVAATASNPAFSVSRIETDGGATGYTVHTLERLRMERPDAEIHLIMGADEAAAFPAWREPDRILEMARLAVATRPGIDEAALREALPGWVTGRVDLLPPMAMDISATDIRARLAARKSVRYLVSDEVRAYIEQHGLYR